MSKGYNSGDGVKQVINVASIKLARTLWVGLEISINAEAQRYIIKTLFREANSCAPTAPCFFQRATASFCWSVFGHAHIDTIAHGRGRDSALRPFMEVLSVNKMSTRSLAMCTLHARSKAM